MHLIVLKKIFCIHSVYPYMNFKKRCIIIILLKINVWYIFFYTKPKFNCIILLLLFLDLKNMSRQLPRFLMSKYKIIDFQDNIGYHFCIDKSRELKIYKFFRQENLKTPFTPGPALLPVPTSGQGCLLLDSHAEGQPRKWLSRRTAWYSQRGTTPT